MKVTLYDDYIESCLRNKDTLLVCKAMEQALEQTRPIAHLWEAADPFIVSLRNQTITWPDAAMCLCMQPCVTPGYYTFCVDQGYPGPIFESWIEQQMWSWEGMLVFQLDDKQFDVIPLVRCLRKNIIMPEMQLHFVLTPDGWAWSKANTGPVNAFFHDVLIRAIEKEEHNIDERIEWLGNIVSYCLGTYYSHIGQPGEWKTVAPREPKLKVKNGVVKKIYRQGTVGYKQFIPRA